MHVDVRRSVWIRVNQADTRTVSEPGGNINAATMLFHHTPGDGEPQPRGLEQPALMAYIKVHQDCYYAPYYNKQ